MRFFVDCSMFVLSKCLNFGIRILFVVEHNLFHCFMEPIKVQILLMKLYQVWKFPCSSCFDSFG